MIYSKPSSFRVGVELESNRNVHKVHEDCNDGEDNNPEKLRVKSIKLALTPGDPAGIGPDCCLLALANNPQPCDIVVIASLELLTNRAKQLGLDIDFGALNILDVPLSAPVIAGKPDPCNADYTLKTLQLATKSCLEGAVSGLVTGPINKAVIHQSGVPFTGHTGYLQDLTHSPLVQMLFVHEKMRVGLVTTHIPLHAVSSSLTSPLIQAHIECLAKSLQQYWHIPHPRIAVLGLNPHAGEQGLLGTEEQTIIGPAMMAAHSSDWTLTGPLPADTAFIPNIRNQFDGILALYHDQALGPLKALGFGQAVNVTLGLPFIRTSVDHGTAYSKAGTGHVEFNSLQQAIHLAHTLCHQKI